MMVGLGAGAAAASKLIPSSLFSPGSRDPQEDSLAARASLWIQTPVQVISNMPSQPTLRASMAPGQSADGIRVCIPGSSGMPPVSQTNIDKVGNVTSYAIQGMFSTKYFSTLQEAIDTIPDGGPMSGGCLFVPDGVKECLPTTIHSNVSIFGAGKKSSILSWANDNTTVDAIGLKPSSPPDTWDGLQGQWLFRDLWFKGNGKQGVAKRCITNLLADWCVENGMDYYKSWNMLQFESCRLSDWGGDIVALDAGVNPDPPDPPNWYDGGWGGFTRFTKTTIAHGGGHGIVLTLTDMRPFLIEGCEFRDFSNGMKYCLRAFSQFPMYCINNSFEGAWAGAFVAGARNFIFDGNHFKDLWYGWGASDNSANGRLSNNHFARCWISITLDNAYMVDAYGNLIEDSIVAEWPPGTFASHPGRLGNGLTGTRIWANTIVGDHDQAWELVNVIPGKEPAYLEEFYGGESLNTSSIVKLGQTKYASASSGIKFLNGTLQFDPNGALVVEDTGKLTAALGSTSKIAFSSGSQLIVPVHTIKAAPVDATHGTTPGTLVVHVYESGRTKIYKLYIRGLTKWKSVSLVNQ